MAKKKNNKTLLNEIVAIRESIPDEAKNLQAQLMREKLDNLVISATEFFENEGLDTETENNKESIVKNNKLIPKCLKKYDVILAEVGPVRHYAVVFKIDENLVYAMPITSQTGVFNGFDITKSRIFAGVLIYQILQIPLKKAITNFIMPYDSKKEIDDALISMKQHYFTNKIF